MNVPISPSHARTCAKRPPPPPLLPTCCSRSCLALLVFLSAMGIWGAGCGHRTSVPAPQPSPSVGGAAAGTPPPATKPDPGETLPPAATGLDPNTPSRGPSIRIGLGTTAREVRVSARGRFFLVQKIPEAQRHVIQGEVQVRVETRSGTSQHVYSVQVVSLAKPGAAEALARDLEKRFVLPVRIRERPDSAIKQIRVGAFATRQEAERFAEGPASRAGFRDAFVVQESGVTDATDAVLALRGPNDLFLLSKQGYLFLPATESNYLRLAGRPYRGLFDITLNTSGHITVVNQLPVEDYLLGVVPAEMSPYQYPEQAALAAQAIAARTYALKHKGRYQSEGFDLTDDTRTQVYGGVAAEREATNEAVRNTRGLAIYYEGELIDAMYTSTCGGRTEDFANVYDAAPVPYLRSVICAVESEGMGDLAANLTGNHAIEEVLYSDGGQVVNRDLELALVLGLTEADGLTREYLEGVPDEGEVEDWIERARALGHIPDAEDAPAGEDTTSRAGFLQHLAKRIFGTGEIERRISGADAAYYMSNIEDGAEIPAHAHHALAYVMQRGLWQPYPDNSMKPGEPILRKDALALMARWIQSTNPEIIRSAVLLEPSAATKDRRTGPAIAVKWDNRSESYALAENVRLFKISDGRSIPASRLLVIGNERARFHLAEDGRIDFLEIELNTTGANSDRFSPMASWEVTMTRADVAERLQSLAPGTGLLRDIKPARLGNSGRVVEMEVVGSRDSKILNGYKVRNALGLRDTLFALERSYNPDGAVRSFTFHGRGYGHGVGLCQVGAYGMALAGRSFEEILKTYYQGVVIARAYDQ